MPKNSHAKNHFAPPPPISCEKIAQIDSKAFANTQIIYVAMAADLLHPGHINILKIARKLADELECADTESSNDRKSKQDSSDTKICDEKAGLRSFERGDKTLESIAQTKNKLPALSRKALSPKAEVVLGLLTDKAIASYKRLPYMTYEQRFAVISELRLVDRVIPQDTLSYEHNIRALKPRYVIHGDDWKNGAQASTRQNVIDTLKELGCGELLEPSYTEGISSTQLNLDARAIGISTNARLSLLRRLLSAKTPLRICETHSAISALIAQNASTNKDGVRLEFDGFWSSSLTDSTSRGKPDIEAVELTSRLNTINEIFEVTTKPLIYDADTGGKIEHFVFTVRSLERTGVSAVIIEDKTGLKKNSLLGNDVEQTQEDMMSFCDKIRAGKNAQITQDFMIIARIESLILEKGQEDALKRAFAYIEAGADGIMIHSRQKSPDEVLAFLQAFRAQDSKSPVVVVPTSFNAISAQELGRAGANIIIYANHLLRASFVAMKEVAQGILENDRSKEVESKCMSVKEILSLIPGTI